MCDLICLGGIVAIFCCIIFIPPFVRALLPCLAYLISGLALHLSDARVMQCDVYCKISFLFGFNDILAISPVRISRHEITSTSLCGGMFEALE